MGYFTEHDVLTQMAKQTAFGAVPGSPNGIVVPIAKSAQGFDHTRNRIDNDARYADGYNRRFALGNHKSMGDLPLVANLDYFGYPLYGFCGSMTETGCVNGVTVTAGGTGYTTNFAVTFTGGAGTGAAGTAVVSGGQVVSVIMTNRGTGYTSAPSPSFAAGSGTGAAGTAVIGTKHSGKPGNTVIYYVGEEQIGENFYQYLDQVYSELAVQFDVEGMFKPGFKTVGSGNLTVATSSMDSTPTEVAGGPAEMLNWGTLEDGVDDGIITKASLTVTREVLEVRPSGGGATQLNGKCIALVIGNKVAKLNITALVKDDSRWAKARNGVVTNIKLSISRGLLLLDITLPEYAVVPSGPKKGGGLVQLELEGEGIYEANSASPVTFDLYNTIATHNA